MKAALIIAASLMFSCAAVEGAEREFDDIVQAVSDQLHARPLHIPLFGLVNVATWVARPAGVKHLNLAVFENLQLDDHTANEIAEAIGSSDGGWRPFVRSRGHGEAVLVYMAQQRNDCKLLVAAIESGELTLVELKLNPDAIRAWLREPETSAAKQRRPSE
jgi:hypothetical protein